MQDTVTEITIFTSPSEPVTTLQQIYPSDHQQ